MNYLWRYETPKGFDDMWMSGDGEVLTGLWFDGSKDTGKHQRQGEEQLLPVFKETIRWLDTYFAGGVPDFTPVYSIGNLTDFRREVQEIMREIPYGKTATHGDIAREIAEKRGIEKMSAQAVGGAVGANPICIIVPCHRVMGAGGKITGYGGGIENKIALLKLEGTLE
ncbi:MAG: methylated-DNA--[Firmicutes bacterium]|nr:methylated-DNA--[protein]-cysteine S-methyltransferase [Bacillota bacterium]